VVAANTGPVSRRRAMRMAMPTRVNKPATVPRFVFRSSVEHVYEETIGAMASDQR
jgi:hypothetical protein